MTAGASAPWHEGERRLQLANPRAGLLFVDFATGDLLQLTGRTRIALADDAIAHFAGAERIWRFEAERMVRRRGATRLRWRFQGASPHLADTGTWPPPAEGGR